MRSKMLRTSMTFLPLLVLLLAAEACTAPEESAAVPALEGDRVAAWQGDALVLSDVEEAVAEARTPACRRARRAAGGGSLDDLVPCYQEVAESLALEALVSAEIDVEQAVLKLVQEEPQLRRHTYMQAWLERTRADIEVDDLEIEAWFASHREQYRRPAQLTVSNIFRRHDLAAGPEAARAATRSFLRDLKARYEAGETFSALAREHSHSETRLRGGLVGRLSEGRLPKRLEEIALALGDGDVSDPIPVSGGAVLLHVTGLVEGTEFSLDEVRGRVRRQVIAKKIAERQRRRAAAVTVPDDAQILAVAEVLTILDEVFPPDGQLDTGEPAAERPVLAIGDQSLSAGTMRQLAGLRGKDRAADLDDEGRQRVAEVYEGQIEQMLLVLGLATSAEPGEVELRQEAEEHLRHDAIARVVDERLQEEMWKLVDADPERLRGFFDDNQPHYQTALRFKIHSWDLLFGADPPRQLRRMEELRLALVAGETELTAAVAELGGSLLDLGWRELDELEDEIPPKARDYLLQAASGYSVPFQQDEALHLLWVEERQEPRQQTYGEVTEEVRDGYYERFEQDLYRQVVDQRLANAGFIFSEDAVRTLLGSALSPAS